MKDQSIKVRARLYQYAPPKLQALRNHIDDLLKKEVITPSNFLYACPAFLAPRKMAKPAW